MPASFVAIAADSVRAWWRTVASIVNLGVARVAGVT